MKKVILISLLSLILIICCSCTNSRITLNGNVEETINVNSQYIDLGVNCPKDYAVVTIGSVNTNKLGQYFIKYLIYNKGHLEKELHRYVNVVDNTAPYYEPINNSEYLVGRHYNIDDFISTYGDNFDKKDSISVSPTKFYFAEEKAQVVSIEFKDSSNNSTIFTKTIYPKINIIKAIEEAYCDEQDKYSKGSTPNAEYIHVEIDYYTTISAYSTGLIYYDKFVSTSFGDKVLLRFIAKYGQFNKAHISYQIVKNGNVGFSGSIYDVNLHDLNPRVNSFSSLTSNDNKLGLDENAVLAEINDKLPSELTAFKEYFINKLNLTLM